MIREMTWRRRPTLAPENFNTINTTNKWLTRFTLSKTLDTLDQFKREMPTFNLQGRTAVSSLAGGVMTVVIFSVMMLYALVKFAHLMSNHNPNISSHRQPDYFDSSEIFDLKEHNLRFAFNVEGYFDRQVKDDPTYVKYLVRIWGKKGG